MSLLFHKINKLSQPAVYKQTVNVLRSPKGPFSAQSSELRGGGCGPRDIGRKEGRKKSTVHTRRAPPGRAPIEVPASHPPTWGTVKGAGQGLGKNGQALLGLPETSWLHSAPESSFQSWSTFGPQIRASSLHSSWTRKPRDFLDWLNP